MNLQIGSVLLLAGFYIIGSESSKILGVFTSNSKSHLIIHMSVVQELVNHGHDPRLTRKVHITQARELLSRGQMIKHPAVVLHELAHGYHDQILSFEQPEILAAYKKARESGTYTNVLLYTGQRVKHYALTDHKEYFAEGTEAYLYRNDFYPFVRAELKEHDPTLHEALVKIWGPAN